MFHSALLETLIAVTVVLLAYSTIVSLFVEYINNANSRQKRQMYLYDSIRKALNDPKEFYWGDLVYQHPHIASLKSTTHRFPAYIASSTFADALLAVIKEHHFYSLIRIDPQDRDRVIIKLDPLAGKPEFEQLTECINDLPEGNFKRLMRSFLMVPNNNKMETFTNNIKIWFDNYQDRVTGEYKKSIRRDLLWFGITFAVLFNINILVIIKAVATDGNLRTSLVAQAETAVKKSIVEPGRIICNNCTMEEFEKKYNEIVSRGLMSGDTLINWLSTSGLPIGWELPQTHREIVISYLTNEIKTLTKLKKDTVENLQKKYCLISSYLQAQGQLDTDAVHRMTIELLACQSPDADILDSLGRKYAIDFGPYAKKGITHFFTKVASTDSQKCFPEEATESTFQECLAGCKAIDQLQFQEAVKALISDRIRNNQLEIELYDRLYNRTWYRHPKQLAGFPAAVLKYNLRDPQDWIVFFFGTVLMGLAGVVSSNVWFKILVQLFNLRSVGVKPKKQDEK
jgi:hypothetical protein